MLDKLMQKHHGLPALHPLMTRSSSFIFQAKYVSQKLFSVMQYVSLIAELSSRLTAMFNVSWQQGRMSDLV